MAIASSDHRSSFGFLFTVLTLIAAPPSLMATMCSLDFAAIPSHVPSTHLDLNESFLFVFLALSGFAQTCSPNSKMAFMLIFPISLCLGTLPSWPTSATLIVHAACSCSHCSSGPFVATFAFILCSRPSFIALTCPIISCTACSAAPLEAGSYAGGFCGIVLCSRAFFISSATCTSAGSPSVLRMMPVYPNPSIASTNLFITHLSCPPLAVHVNENVILVLVSLATIVVTAASSGS